MPRENKTRYAVLGMLSLKPMTGYEMKGIISQSVANFWNESFGQIYPVLNQLAREGMVVGIEETEGRHNRTRYSLTEKGHQVLQDWIATPPETISFRDELLLKLFFGRETNSATLRGHLENTLAQSRAQLATYQGIEAQLRNRLESHPQLRFSLLTVRKGIHWEQAMIAWCLESLTALAPVIGQKNHPVKSGKPDGKSKGK